MGDGPTNPNILIGLKPISPLRSIDTTSLTSPTKKEMDPIISPTKLDLAPVNKPGLETVPMFPQKNEFLNPPNHTPLPPNIVAKPELDKATADLQNALVNSLGLNKEVAEKIATTPQEHAPSVVKEKTLLDKILGPLKGIGIGALVILVINLWKGIQSFFGKKDSGASMGA